MNVRTYLLILVSIILLTGGLFVRSRYSRDFHPFLVSTIQKNVASELDAADGSYSRVDAHGFYWTVTESDTAKAWFYNFGKNGKILNRHPDGEKHMAISVRCIRDGGNTKEQ